MALEWKKRQSIERVEGKYKNSMKKCKFLDNNPDDIKLQLIYMTE